MQNRPHPNLRKYFRYSLYPSLILAASATHASFIESTIGTAVVNDATAVYHNPAALTLLTNQQLVALGSLARFRTSFTGQTTQTSTGFTQTGTSSSQTNYFLPSLYWGKPVTGNFSLGFGVISNFFNNSIGDSSILRYVKPTNDVKDIDLIPALGYKVNDYLSLGAAINFSLVKLDMQPTSGFPTLDVPDTQSRNVSNGTGVGGDAGILLKPGFSTLIGVNYHTSVSYQLSGNSYLPGSPGVNSNQYHFTFWTPARTVISTSHFVTPTLGFIGTVQRIQWSIIQNLNVNGIATLVGSKPAIVNATLPYHLRDSWIVTLGGQYRPRPKLIIRAAGSYVQSPGNGSYQLANGNSYVLGASVGYEINKHIILDGSYAHAFMQDASIHIVSKTNTVNGVNQGSRDAVSIKLTYNI